MKNNHHTAIGRCKKCKMLLVSEGGGRFLYCKCKKSFIDQERRGGAWTRYGGECEYIEQICSPTCKQKKEHNNWGNKEIETVEELQKYLLDTYNYKHSTLLPDNK